MEPEGSLPCSQELSTGPYPEPDQSNLYHPILSLRSMVGGSLVTTAWRVLRLRMEAANVLNKQSRIADKG
jgi:hypothetical protein